MLVDIFLRPFIQIAVKKIAELPKHIVRFMHLPVLGNPDNGKHFSTFQ